MHLESILAGCGRFRIGGYGAADIVCVFLRSCLTALAAVRSCPILKLVRITRCDYCQKYRRNLYFLKPLEMPGQG